MQLRGGEDELFPSHSEPRVPTSLITSDLPGATSRPTGLKPSWAATGQEESVKDRRVCYDVAGRAAPLHGCPGDLSPATSRGVCVKANTHTSPGPRRGALDVSDIVVRKCLVLRGFLPGLKMVPSSFHSDTPSKANKCMSLAMQQVSAKFSDVAQRMIALSVVDVSAVVSSTVTTQHQMFGELRRILSLGPHQAWDAA